MSPHRSENLDATQAEAQRLPNGTPVGAVAFGPISRGFWWWFLIIIMLGVALRTLYLDQKTPHMDEEIAQAVVSSLHFPDQLDTNWAKSNVSEVFRYGQYNFSSYHYLLFAWKELLTVFGIDCSGGPAPLRALNGLLGMVFLGAIALGLRQIAGELAALAAALSGAIIPLLVQDAHYLRCEAMLTAAVATMFWLSTWRDPRSRWIPFAGGVMAGWLIASKVTMVLALPLLAPLLLPAALQPLRNWKAIGFTGGIIGLGCMLGFVLGIPGAVADPQTFFSGLDKMAQQYRSPMPPHTTPDMTPSLQVTLIYMKETLGWGFWILVVLGVGGMIRVAGWWRMIPLFATLMATLCFFGNHAFFAERSFSPFLPIAVIFFGTGIQFLNTVFLTTQNSLRRLRVLLLGLALVATLVVPAIYSWQILFHGFSGREQDEKDAALSRMKGNFTGKKLIIYNVSDYAHYYQVIAQTTGNHVPMLIVIVDYYDAYSSTGLRTLQDKYGARVLGMREGLFPELPTCSLNTLISPRLWLLYIPAK